MAVGQQPAGIKRPGEVAPTGGAIKKPALPATAVGKDAPKYSVTSQSKTDDIGIQTLVGDYADRGANHGKRFYQKLQKIPGHEEIKVFLYYWDNRDGADFSGWWFGDQVGGTQVWARCSANTPTPPKVGWKVPWDSPTAKPGLLSVDPYKAAAATTPATTTPTGSPASTPRAATDGASPMALAARVKKITAQVETAEKAALALTQKAKTTLAATAPVPEATLKDLQLNLQKQQAAVGEAMKALSQDINEVRKAGPSATASVTELSKLLPRIRTAQAGIVENLNKARAALAKAGGQGAAQQEQNKEKEEKDKKDFEGTISTIKDLTSAAEESVTAVAATAEPIMSSPPPEGSDDLKKALEEVETAANDAQTKISEARKEITQKLQTAKQYAVEARKTAIAEYSALQSKLTEAQKKLLPFRTFKKDFQNKVKAKQALSDLADKLSNAELEVEKAAMMSIAAESGQMSEEEIAACTKVAEPAQTAVMAALRDVEGRLRNAQTAMKEELSSLKDRGLEMKKKCETVMATMRSQRQGINAQQMAASITEKVVLAEEALVLCQDAEMPFLKGIEVLPAEESTKAISDCEAASAKADVALTQARGLIKQKQAESKRFPKELQEKAASELTQLSQRTEACGKKVADFKKETAERKLNALMAEVVEGIKVAENKVKAHAEVAKVFSDDLNHVTEEAIKEAMEKVGEVEKEALDAVQEARKQLTNKQKDVKGPAAAGAMSKLQGRLKTASDELMKNKKASTFGDKLLKGKEALAEEMGNVDKAEAEVAKVEKLAEPVEAVENPTDEECAELGDAIVNAQNAIKATARSIDANMSTNVPSMKAAFSKVSERSKKVQERLDKVLVGKKGLRERSLGEAYVREGKKKTDAVDGFVEKVNDAELPFLKGIEVLPLTEATSTIDISQKAAAELQNAITEARNFIAAKSVELKGFTDKEKTKPLIEELTSLTGRVNAAATKLASFKKDTDSRRKNAQLQEAGEKITKAEAEVEKVTEAAAPLSDEAAESMSADEAAGICEKAGEQAKTAQAAVDESRQFLSARVQENKSNANNAETLKTLQTRLAAAGTALTKAKKVVSNQEHKFVAKKLMQEVEAKVEGLEGEVKAAEEACAPLLENGGSQFLVAASLKTLASSLRSYMKDKGLDVAGLIKEASGGSLPIPKEDFVTYLQKLPETTSRPEVEFTQERREALASFVDADADGKISESEFKDIFKQKFICVTGISMTDALQVSSSKTTGKVEPDEVLDALGDITKDEATGMERVEVKAIGSGKQGFVTLKGNQGTTYLQEFSPFTDFCAVMDKKIEERLANVRTVTSFLTQKTNELAQHSTGPLAEARTEIAKLRPKASTSSAEIQKLKGKVAVAKKEFAKAEAAEKTAHIEAKERREAEAILSEASKELEAAEGDAAKVTTAAEELLGVQGEELMKFATPATVLEEVEKLTPAAISALSKVKTAIMSKSKDIKVPKGPLAEARKELVKLLNKAEVTSKKSSSTLQAVKAACKTISEAADAKASEALRSEASAKGISVDELFVQLAGAGSETISHEALCKRFASISSLELPAEHARLLCKKIEEPAISKRNFLGFVQRYYVVTSAIAITSEFEISKAKTVRKAEQEEIFEILEGPRPDEKLGVNRVRGRSLVDSTEGWLSIKGNQGSVFLKEVEKPFYTVCGSVEVQLDPGFKVGEGEPVRMLPSGEVLEMLEGPKKETFPPGLRAKCQALSDKATGWFSIRDKQGNTFADENKYYTCVSSVAITDNFDIKDCKVVKKLSVGDLFVVEEGPVVQEESGVTRVKAKTMEDNQEGWVTVKGNAGTSYAAASKAHYAIVKEVKLQKTMASSSEEVRVLSPGEAVKVIEGPKEEVHQAAMRVKVKATSDGSVGWVTVLPSSVKRCTAKELEALSKKAAAA